MLMQHVRMKRVVITDYLEPPAKIESKVLAGVAEVECLLAKSTQELFGKLTDADGLILCHEVSITREVLQELHHCRAVVRCGVGFDNIDRKAAGEMGIYVCNVPDYGVDEVADHAIAMMLACNRGLIKAERSIRRSLNPWDMRAIQPVFRVAGAKMGIIGLGRIGGATAVRAKGLRMDVVAHDPYVRAGTDKLLGVPLVELEELLRTCDVVSVHTPLTEESRQMIDGKALDLMKPTAILINTARGAVVDTDALAVALREGSIAGAGIDVLPEEPARSDMPLIQLWQEDTQPPVNLIVTPHTAFYSDAGLLEMRTKAAMELKRILSGQKPKNCVNIEFLR
ncbi:MAG TPA: C-terminal binding protein [Verrucomicrobiales bacterium]|jgi:D-3-phosphoglycerate dehydrogenase/C-terminal binding protein|nr:2-hydroxyacid dehydrogenase [Pedosphaera sp.]RZO72556.1 MAG: C-terminal binding protein [Limisphaerales bacterium]HAO66302.1 C-terminal binding protein [Verrucomicrobiales bacterium]HAQ99634.1 C-terminal binding protein [Verrucomicrobiales bacterium]HAW00779.1 C-terminal binding protein [Verrucomicrobiales bacterium]|tara:strand:+ start:1419 stop:2435 length:1017 start_codon:yes stop_codon:yes gene_type:complete